MSPDFQAVDIDSLLFILDDGADANLLNEIDVYQQKFITLRHIVEQRNIDHSETQKYPRQPFSPLVVMAISTSLKDMTDSLYNNFDDALSSNINVSGKLHDYLKKKYPREKPLRMEPI
jgi:hypothetical protein